MLFISSNRNASIEVKGRFMDKQMVSHYHLIGSPTLSGLENVYQMAIKQITHIKQFLIYYSSLTTSHYQITNYETCMHGK